MKEKLNLDKIKLFGAAAIIGIGTASCSPKSIENNKTVKEENQAKKEYITGNSREECSPLFLGVRPKTDEKRMQNRSFDEKTTPKELIQLSESEDWVVQRGVASNPNTPKATLKEYTYDQKRDVCVRETAAKELKRRGENIENIIK